MAAIMASTGPEAWPRPDAELDARGLECPEPALRLRQALRDAPPGHRVRICATDPHARLDVEALCVRGGHLLEGVEAHGRTLWLQVRKGTGRRGPPPVPD